MKITFTPAELSALRGLETQAIEPIMVRFKDVVEYKPSTLAKLTLGMTLSKETPIYSYKVSIHTGIEIDINEDYTVDFLKSYSKFVHEVGGPIVTTVLALLDLVKALETNVTIMQDFDARWSNSE